MKLINKIAIFGAAAITLTGCKDFLVEDNKSSANEDGNSYVAESPAVLRATTFNALRANIVNVDMQDLASDLFYCARKSNDDAFSQFAITQDNGDVEKFYTNNGKAINYANAMIKFGGEGSKLSEEGRFIRAYCYYYQTQQFGGVPYVTEYIESSSRDYPRMDLGELYTKLIEDLTNLYNTSSLPAQDHKGNISKQAVAALLARIYLAAGWDIQTTLTDAAQGTYAVNSTEYFTQAAQWAEKAIDGTQLTMSFEDKWSPFNEGNNEVIWAIQYQREAFPGDVNTGGHSLQNNYKADYNSPNLSGQKGDNSGGPNMTTEKSVYLFGKGDQRFDATFMTTMYNAKMNGSVAEWGTQGYYAFYNVAAAELAKMPIAVKFFPYNTTVEEAKAYLAEHKAQTLKFANKTYGCDNPFAVILDPNAVIKFPFKEDGSYSQDAAKTFAQFSSEGAFNGMAVKKFDDPESIQSTKDNDYRNVVAFHVSEMYLVAAEAYLMAGDDAKALAKINDVRRRAGAELIPSFDAYQNMVSYTVPYTFGNITKLDCLLDEYAREMYAERTRWYDLRRTRQLVRYNLAFNRNIHSVEAMSNAKGEIKWYRPIPETEINNNTAMSFEKDQNPGY